MPGPIPRTLGRRLRAGVELEDGPVRVDSFAVVDVAAGRAVVEIVLHEGRKHVVRRLLAAVDHPVSRLVRTAVGPVQLGHQRQGTVPRLSQKEIGDLHRWSPSRHSDRSLHRFSATPTHRSTSLSTNALHPSRSLCRHRAGMTEGRDVEAR